MCLLCEKQWELLRDNVILLGNVGKKCFDLMLSWKSRLCLLWYEHCEIVRAEEIFSVNVRKKCSVKCCPGNIGEKH